MSYCEEKNEVKTEYSLIKHLNILCSQDEKYKDLYAAWTLDKEVYSKALSAIIMNFPHYSMHDSSHSASIINKIEMLLGEERIKSLSPTDTFMILESAYLHDFGMIVANSELLDVWGKSSFQRYLKSLQESIYDKDIAESAELLLKIQDNKNLDLNNKLNWPVRVRNAVTIIAAEYFRKKHNIRSAEWIENPQKLGIDINFNKLIPDRIIRMIGKVSISHGTSFEDMFYGLEKEGNGIGTDRAHPRLIGCLLRIGDLLDLDNGRFNEVTENTGKFPKSSELHKKKHASITHFLVCPKRIEVSAICDGNDVYRVTRAWFDSLEKELKNLSCRWAEIVPDDFQGGPPSLGEIKISIKGVEKDTEQRDWRFSINQERAFELIEGKGIYDTELVFIRELLQNALDASKMQMWKDIKNEKYDDLKLKKYQNIRPSQLKKEDILFYDDIEEVTKFYPINIEVSYQKNNIFEDKTYSNENSYEGEYIFTIEDRGCGISLNDLKRMENVGGSWKQDDNLADFIESMPICLKPTGSFGLGLHSAFMVTDEMKINTKAEENRAYDINFVSRRKNGYISVRENNKRKRIGTKITLSIKNSKMGEVIKYLKEGKGLSYKFKKPDYFSKQFKVNSVFMYLASYINEYIEKINIFCINCVLDKKSINNFKIVSEELENRKKILERQYNFNEKGLSYFIFFDKNGILKTEVKDKRYHIIVFFDVNTEGLHHDEKWIIGDTLYFNLLKIFFKDIKCNERYYDYKFEYFNVELDILAGEAKEVLDVARNQLKPQIRDYYLNRVNEIFKDYLCILQNTYFEDKDIKNEVDRKIKGDKYYEVSMFMFQLAYKNNIKNIQNNYSENFRIEDWLRLDNGNKMPKPITYDEFIASNEFIIAEYYIEDEKLKDYLKEIDSNGSITRDRFKFRNKETFQYKYIIEKFKVSEIKCIKNRNFIILVKDNDKMSKCFYVEHEVYKSLIGKLITDNSVRSVIYPVNVKKADTIEFDCLVVNKGPNNASETRMLLFDKYFIISPFANISRDECLKMNNTDLLIERLRKKANFNELVEFVAINSIQNKDRKIEEGSKEYEDEIENVEKAYKILIKEYLIVAEEEKKKEEQEEEKKKEEINNNSKDEAAAGLDKNKIEGNKEVQK